MFFFPLFWKTCWFIWINETIETQNYWIWYFEILFNIIFCKLLYPGVSWNADLFLELWIFLRKMKIWENIFHVISFLKVNFLFDSMNILHVFVKFPILWTTLWLFVFIFISFYYDQLFMCRWTFLKMSSSSADILLFSIILVIHPHKVILSHALFREVTILLNYGVDKEVIWVERAAPWYQHITCSSIPDTIFLNAVRHWFNEKLWNFPRYLPIS